MVDRIEIVRRALDAYNRQEVEALLTDADEQVEWRSGMAGSLEGDIYRGRAGIERDRISRVQAYIDPREARRVAGMADA